MDAKARDKARNKARFRAKLSFVNKDKPIDSPLVRYNESDQPMCRVCDVAPRPRVSTRRWAIDNFKASAAAAKQNGTLKKVSEPKRQGSLVGHATGEGFDGWACSCCKGDFQASSRFLRWGCSSEELPVKPVSTKKLGEEAIVPPYNGVQQSRNCPSVSEGNEEMV